METFNNFITEQKNTHMTHIEDKVLYGGVDGTRQAINALRGLRDMLAGSSAGRCLPESEWSASGSTSLTSTSTTSS